jgi:hypothetical protein
MIDTDQRRGAAASRSAVPSNGPLTSLSGGSLAKRFHAWSGRSGRRYICSVFPVKADESEAGLPDFAGAIVIAVGIDADLRRPIAFFDSTGEASETSDLRHQFLGEALAASAREWHVHLLATDPEHRQLVKADLENAWLEAGAERKQEQAVPQG